MPKWIWILSLVLLIIPGYSWSQEQEVKDIAICLLDLDTPPDKDLGYVVKAVNTAIANGLSQFPEITIYTSSSAPAKYFKEPSVMLKADKVRLLQIRRETGFDGLIFGNVKEAEGILSDFVHDFREKGMRELVDVFVADEASDETYEIVIEVGLAQGKPQIEIESVIEFARFNQKPIATFQCGVSGGNV